MVADGGLVDDSTRNDCGSKILRVRVVWSGKAEADRTIPSKFW
jgi:hypothetical protein